MQLDHALKARGERIAKICDGSVHHLMAHDCQTLGARSFDDYMRKYCSERGMRARIRRLGDHILFQAEAQ